MVKLKYTDESGNVIQFELTDWDAVNYVAHGLVNAPINLDYIEYQDGNEIGLFNLNTFEKY